MSIQTTQIFCFLPASLAEALPHRRQCEFESGAALGQKTAHDLDLTNGVSSFLLKLNNLNPSRAPWITCLKWTAVYGRISLPSRGIWTFSDQEPLRSRGDIESNQAPASHGIHQTLLHLGMYRSFRQYGTFTDEIWPTRNRSSWFAPRIFPDCIWLARKPKLSAP